MCPCTTASSMQEEGSLKTHSLHADIIVNLSGSKHIAAALNTFGVTTATKDLLVAKINASGANPACTDLHVPVHVLTYSAMSHIMPHTHTVQVGESGHLCARKLEPDYRADRVIQWSFYGIVMACASEFRPDCPSNRINGSRNNQFLLYTPTPQCQQQVRRPGQLQQICMQ